MLNPIVVNYEYTSNLYQAKQWLESLTSPFAADFEVASRFSKEEKELFKFRLENFNLPFEEVVLLKQYLLSDGLSHPSLTYITHLSVANSEDKAYVIVCPTDTIRAYITHFLITTEHMQIWHNACYDFKHLYYHTNKIPKNYTDTQLLSKNLINDADSFKGRTGLKELMGNHYGDWAISKDNFTLEEMWNESTIRYSAIDSTATYKLYTLIQEELTSWKI